MSVGLSYNEPVAKLVVREKRLDDTEEIAESALIAKRNNMTKKCFNCKKRDT